MNTTLYPNNASIDDIWFWYVNNKKLLKSEYINPVNFEDIVGMTQSEKEDYFKMYFQELEYLTAFKFLARIEALFRNDFHKKGAKK